MSNLTYGKSDPLMVARLTRLMKGLLPKPKPLQPAKVIPLRPKNVRRRVTYPIGEQCFLWPGDQLDLIEQRDRAPLPRLNEEAETRKKLTFGEWAEMVARRATSSDPHNLS